MPILERLEPLRAVAGYLDEARAGHGRLTFVAGEAGIGKTTFVTQAIADAAGQARVALGACDGSATPAPLGPLTEMLAQLPPEVWQAGASRHTVFSLLVDALRAPMQSEPYLLVIEDAHWADEATLDLIRHLARRVDHCRALVLVTYRPEDARSASGLRVLLGDTASAAGIRRIDLAPLSPAAVVESSPSTPGPRPGPGPSTPPSCTTSPAATPSSSPRCSPRVGPARRRPSAMP